MASNPFRPGIPLWLPPAIFGAVAAVLCACVAAEGSGFIDVRPLLYLGIVVLWVGATSFWFVIAASLRAERMSRELDEDEDPSAKLHAMRERAMRIPASRASAPRPIAPVDFGGDATGTGQILATPQDPSDGSSDKIHSPSVLEASLIGAARPRLSPFSLFQVYVAVSAVLFCALPMIDRLVAAQQFNGREGWGWRWFEMAIVPNVLIASFVLAYWAGRKPRRS